MIPDKAVQAAHAAICEQSLDDCLDPDWRGKCVKAVEAAAPYIRAQTLEAQASINAALERIQKVSSSYALPHRVAVIGNNECPPRMDGDKPHCPDCSGIVGESGVVW